jgi:hypothetical protein
MGHWTDLVAGETSAKILADLPDSYGCCARPGMVALNN